MSGLVPEVVETAPLLPYLRPGELAPLQRRGRRESRALGLQDQSARLKMHGLELAEEVADRRLEAITRVVVRAAEAHAVVEDALKRSEVRAVTLERQSCELEPGGIPRIVELGVRGSMQRAQLLEEFGQELLGVIRATRRW